MTYIKHISRSSKKDKTGNKADGIRFLYNKKFKIPETYVINDEARRSHSLNPKKTEIQLIDEIRSTLDTSLDYAVRSSSLFEDSENHSFAGQFETILNVRGEQNLLKAIIKVWQSGSEKESSGYAKKIKIDRTGPEMGVIVQEMVAAKWSGVGFSINPVTGRHEIIIEGLEGSGEKLVQEGLNPLRWIYKQGVWEAPEDKKQPDKELLEEIKSGLLKLKRLLKKEVDIEWVYDAKTLYYLQCRPITTDRYPTIYSNYISREVLPGMIKPLVWSVNIPLVNGAWIKLLEEVMGNLDLRAEQLSKSFYFRAYFNMGTLGILFQKLGLPHDALESLMGRKKTSGKSAFRPGLKTMSYLPGMVVFMVKNLSLGKRFSNEIPMLERNIDQLQKQLNQDFHIDQYAEYFKKIEAVASRLAYYNIIIPLAMQITTAMLRRKIQKRNMSLDQFSFHEDFPRLKEYDPQISIKALYQKWSLLPEKTRDAVKSHKDLQLKLKGLDDFKNDFDILLHRFGHFSESGNDFSYPPWRENPDFLLTAIKNESDTEQLKGHRSEKTSRLLKSKTYRRAGKFRLYREMISSAYTKGYGLFRVLFKYTGEHLAETGKIRHPDDVFYLTLEQHDALLRSNNKEQIKALTKKIKQVQKEISASENITLPSVIYGELPPPIIKHDHKALRGIPVSSGMFTGEIVVVKGYQDFEKVIDGKILIIPFSDVGWTTILSQAGAIVSESGGILSHASIIARELSIPAISSVDHACQLKDGLNATVDANNGSLIIEESYVE